MNRQSEGEGTRSSTCIEYVLLETDIVAITKDGAKVMVKMGRQLPFTHQLCIAHGLHLAVMDVLYSKDAITRWLGYSKNVRRDDPGAIYGLFGVDKGL